MWSVVKFAYIKSKRGASLTQDSGECIDVLETEIKDTLNFNENLLDDPNMY